jgi:capsular polysaccharide biosynthesis protein
MMSSAWRLEDPGPGGAPLGGSSGLVSLHYLIGALRRRWRTWASIGVAGMVLGVAWTVLLPAPTVGNVSLVLAHEAGTDQTTAMATDVSLLQTRTVAETVIRSLDLNMEPEAFQQSVVVTPITSQVMLLDVRAPNAAEAERRAAQLANTFLEFRSAQLRTRTDSVIAGYKKRKLALQERVDHLTTDYDMLSGGTQEQQSQAAAALTERSQLLGEISTLQESIEDASLQVDAQLAASHVLDPASAVPHGHLKAYVLPPMSGLIGGLAVGVGLVLFSTLASDRLRRRDEVALALGVPVRASVGDLRRRRLTSWWSSAKKERDAVVITHAVQSAIRVDERPSRLVIACVDNIEDGERLTALLAAQLVRAETAVLLVDLGDRGGLAAELTHALGDEDGSAAPSVLRPDGLPHLSTGPFGVPAGTAGLVADDDPRREAWSRAEVVLTLASVDPARGLDELPTWADRVVMLVTAGRSSAERLRTAAELVRSVGLDLTFAVMVGSDRTDESLGLPEPPDEPGSDAQRRILP